MDPTEGTISPEDEVNHFKAIPWCARHLEAPDLMVTPVFNRVPGPHFHDALLSQTLRTRDTIPAFVCFYLRPASEQDVIPEVKAFVTLGNMLSSYPRVSHGGVVATLLDETLSLVAPGCRRQAYKHGALAVVTAYLNTKFLRPVKLPGTYLISVWLKRTEGRKLFVEGVMEDEGGHKVAEADALFVQIPEKL